VYRVHHRCRVIRIHIRRYAVAEVENVTVAAPETVENR
jgi:hypothetical protein